MRAAGRAPRIPETCLERLARFSIDHPRLIVTVILAATVGLGASLPSLEQKFGYRVLLGGDHPAIVRLESVMDQYGGGFPAQIVWRCGDGAPCESVFSPSSIETARELEEALGNVEGVRATLSPASTSLLVQEGDGFAAKRWADVSGESEEEAAFVARALTDPLWLGRVVSKDGKTGAVVALMVDAKNATASRLTDAAFSAVRSLQEIGWTFYFA